MTKSWSHDTQIRFCNKKCKIFMKNEKKVGLKDEDMVFRYWVSDTILDTTILSVLNILAFFGHWMWALLGFLSHYALNISHIRRRYNQKVARVITAAEQRD